MSTAREIDRDEEPRVWNVVEELCIGAGLPLPRIFVISDLSVTEPTLETVFINMTGKDLRD